MLYQALEYFDGLEAPRLHKAPCLFDREGLGWEPNITESPWHGATSPYYTFIQNR